jgi:hypothetical protein
MTLTQLTPADTVVSGSTIVRDRYNNGVMIAPTAHLISRVGLDTKENRIVMKSGDRIFTYRPNDLVLVISGPDQEPEPLTRAAGVDDVWQSS